VRIHKVRKAYLIRALLRNGIAKGKATIIKPRAGEAQYSSYRATKKAQELSTVARDSV
jgi:hypothetical protein